MRTTVTLDDDVASKLRTVEHGATLYSADTDFSRFPGLRWTNPLYD